MKIICDTSLPLGRTLFGQLGTITLLDTAKITSEAVRDADMLIVRNKEVGAELLQGSQVKFVCAAVIGTDTLDTTWLEQQGIRWCSAPGCNAESVADYTVAGLLELFHTRRKVVAGQTIGLIGVGALGKILKKRFETMGFKVLCCDAPRKDNPEDIEAQSFVDLPALLSEADIICLAAPLLREGKYITYHLLDEKALAHVKHGAILLNLSRGGVTDAQAVIRALDAGTLSDAVIDVWEGEEHFNVTLAEKAFLATPHVAGLAYEGKVNGAIAVYRQACNFLGVKPTWAPVLPPPLIANIDIDAAGKKDDEILWYITQKVSLIVMASMNFQETFLMDPEMRAKAFATQRRTHPFRRQFSATTVTIAHPRPLVLEKIAAIGFKVKTR